MDAESYNDEPAPYIISLSALLGVYLILTFSICAWRRLKLLQVTRDRQGNNHSQPSETSRSNRYNDIFFIEANGQEAARIRAQLEKDDKDLPSYDEVMRIANLSHPTAAPTPVADNLITATPPCVLSINGSSSSVNTSETTLAAPAYIESATSLRPLTPPPYTPEPIGATVVLPITTPLHAQPNTHSS